MVRDRLTPPFGLEHVLPDLRPEPWRPLVEVPALEIRLPFSDEGAQSLQLVPLVHQAQRVAHHLAGTGLHPGVDVFADVLLEFGGQAQVHQLFLQSSPM